MLFSVLFILNVGVDFGCRRFRCRCFSVLVADFGVVGVFDVYFFGVVVVDCSFRQRRNSKITKQHTDSVGVIVRDAVNLHFSVGITSC